MSTIQTSDVYYDPYDVAIDADPYPTFQRLREEAPLYYNDRHDFFAVSRYDDVERGLGDRTTFISGRGGVLEIIKAGIEMPPGIVPSDAAVKACPPEPAPRCWSAPRGSPGPAIGSRCA